MTEFEVLLVPVSLILGLGVTRILGSFVAALRRRRSADLHWLPLLWAATILLYLILYFNVVYDVGTGGLAWNWPIYGSVLFQTMLLFLSAGLVLPTEAEIDSDNMLRDFEQDGRLALLPMGLLLGTAPLLNRLQYGAAWLGLNNILGVILTVVVVVAFLAKTHAQRAALGVMFATLSAYGVFFVWAQPGSG